MTKISGSIVFFGSGPVATKSLKHLLKHFNVSEVVTKPTTISEMENLCRSSSTAVFSVSTRGQLDELTTSGKLSNLLGVVVDFGVIISKATIEHFQFGIINSHFSLLPQWRGADPITFSILSGQKQTGVSLMLINESLDEGNLLLQERVPINRGASTPSLTKYLVEKSNKMLSHNIPRYLSGELHSFSQSKSGISYSRKLTKQDGLLDWNKTADELEREIRAYIEWPKSRTVLGGIEVIISKAHCISDNFGEVGGIKIKDSHEILIQCSEGCLSIDTIKPIGKREMSAEAFLAGYKSRLEK